MVQPVNVLSIDVSSSHAKASVIAVRGNELELLESHQCLVQPNLAETSSTAPQTGGVSDNKHPGLPVIVQEMLAKISTPWRSAVVTIPSGQGFSLNLSLPFNDPKQINKILQMEVQDLVPFEIDEYHLAPACFTVANEDRTGTEVRVDITEKAFLKSLLTSFQSQGIDPRIISFPANALASLLEIAPKYFVTNSVIVATDSAVPSECDNITALAVVNGVPCSARTINISKSGISQQDILRELRLFIGSIERRFNISLNRVYILDAPFEGDLVKEILARDYEMISLKDFLKTSDLQTGTIADLLAFQATLPIKKIPANFRTGEFQFRPRFKELTAGLRSLNSYILGFAIASLFCLAAIYISNSLKISTLEQSIKDRIKKTIPSFIAPAGQELSTIAKMAQQVEEQLKDLGSLATLSPLEAFHAVSQDLPGNIGATISEMSIKEARISLKGTVSDYASLDKVEQAFKAKREIYCAITVKDNSLGNRSNSGTSIGFELTLELC